jgi:HK97 gp10 family phage protein
MPVDVSELLALSDDLKKSGAKVRRQVIKAVAKTTADVERDMKAAAPVQSGALRDSITGSAKGLTGIVQPSIRYSVFVLYGTYKDEAQDFLNPPADTAQGTFPSDVEAAVISALDL